MVQKSAEGIVVDLYWVYEGPNGWEQRVGCATHGRKAAEQPASVGLAW